MTFQKRVLHDGRRGCGQPIKALRCAAFQPIGSLRFVTVPANQNTPLRIVSRPIEALHCATCPDQSERSVARRILTNQNTPPLRADQSEPPLPPHPPFAHCIPTADRSAPSLRPIRARRCGACTVPAARPMRSAR